MSEDSPRSVHETFEAAFNAGDLETIVALYEPDAILISAPGKAVRGHEAVRQMLHQFLAVSQKLTLQVAGVFEIDEIALLTSEWQISGIDQQGKAVQLAGQMDDVVRRQKNGSWRIIIDNLWGG